MARSSVIVEVWKQAIFHKDFVIQHFSISYSIQHTQGEDVIEKPMITYTFVHWRKMQDSFDKMWG